MDRLDLHATLTQADAADIDSWWDGTPFDRILLDVPCSATGVIRRHPDIKLLRRESDIVPLASIQLGLLEAMWSILKPGGRLVYATCSVFPQENHRIIQRFLKQQNQATLKTIDADWGRDMNTGRQLLPCQRPMLRLLSCRALPLEPPVPKMSHIFTWNVQLKIKPRREIFPNANRGCPCPA